MIGVAKNWNMVGESWTMCHASGRLLAKMMTQVGISCSNVGMIVKTLEFT